MIITEVRIKLVKPEDDNDRLRAFCSVKFDDQFVVRDLKIIEGPKSFFVAMPSRKITDGCSDCNRKNQVQARYCNWCGNTLAQERASRHEDGRPKLFADIAHPTNNACRSAIQEAVLKAYVAELESAQQADYACTYDDCGQDDDIGRWFDPVIPVSPSRSKAVSGRPQWTEDDHYAEKAFRFGT